MFSEPLTLTINGNAKALTRINQDSFGSEYFLREATGEYRMKIRNTKSTNKSSGAVINRHNVEVTHTLYGVAPAPNVVRRFYTVFEDTMGDTVADLVKFASGVAAFHTDANNTKLLNWES